MSPNSKLPKKILSRLGIHSTESGPCGEPTRLWKSLILVILMNLVTLVNLAILMNLVILYESGESGDSRESGEFGDSDDSKSS